MQHEMAAQPRVGRPRAVTTIVDPNIVVNFGQMTTVSFSMRQLVSECTINTETCVQWLARFGLIANKLRCVRCRNECRLVRDTSTVDGLFWRCPHCNCKKSIRTGSFFSRSKLPLQDLVEIIFHWSHEHKETEVLEDLHVDWKTAVDWYNFMREICCQWCEDHSGPIGGLDQAGNPKVERLRCYANV
jgi:hypothetical protein